MKYLYSITAIMVYLFVINSESNTYCNLSSIFPNRHLKAPVNFQTFNHPKKLITLDSVRSLCYINEIHGTRPSNLPRHFKGKGVLFGIIDTEFDTHHPAFLDSLGKTRFIAVWDQADTMRPNNRFGFGTIKFHQELLKDTLFATAGEPHGTHMTSIAAGSDWKTGYQGVAPEVFIAGVKYSNVRLDVKNGIKWLFSLADSLKLPCVINLSLGDSEGPHDGTSELDMYIDSVVGPGRIVVGAVGNDFAIGTHSLFTLKIGDSTGTIAGSKIHESNSDTIYYSGLDIWGEPQKPIICNLKVFNKIDSSLSFITSLNTSRSTTKNGVYLYKDSAGKYDTVEYKYTIEKANPRNNKPHITILYQTKSSKIDCAITLKPQLTDGIVHCWHLSRGGLYYGGIPGYIGGSSDYSVKEIGGTAKRIIVAGSYYGRISIPIYTGEQLPCPAEFGQIAHFSGSGPTVDGRVKPDITAPGWNVISAHGRNGKPESQFTIWPDVTKNTGRYSESTGTSASAPIVAGLIALMLEANPELTQESALTLIQQSAFRDNFTGPITQPVNRWGAGKLNALGAMQLLLNINSVKNRNKLQNIRATITLKNRLLHIEGIQTNATIFIFDLQGKLILQKNLSGNREFALQEQWQQVYTQL